MASFKLTPRQQEVLKGMVDAAVTAADDEFMFSATMGGSLVKFGRGENDIQLPVSSSEIAIFSQGGFVLLRSRSAGTLTALAHDAVASNFVFPAETASVTNIGMQFNAPIAGGSYQAAVGPGNTLSISGGNEDLIERLAKVTAELIAVVREALPVDAADVTADIEAAAGQLKRQQPSKLATEEATKSVAARLLGAIHTAVQFGDDTGKLATAIERYGVWLFTAWQVYRSKSN